MIFWLLVEARVSCWCRVSSWRQILSEFCALCARWLGGCQRSLSPGKKSCPMRLCKAVAIRHLLGSRGHLCQRRMHSKEVDASGIFNWKLKKIRLKFHKLFSMRIIHLLFFSRRLSLANLLRIRHHTGGSCQRAKQLTVGLLSLKLCRLT